MSVEYALVLAVIVSFMFITSKTMKPHTDRFFECATKTMAAMMAGAGNTTCDAPVPKPPPETKPEPCPVINCRFEAFQGYPKERILSVEEIWTEHDTFRVYIPLPDTGHYLYNDRNTKTGLRITTIESYSQGLQICTTQCGTTEPPQWQEVVNGPPQDVEEPIEEVFWSGWKQGEFSWLDPDDLPDLPPGLPPIPRPLPIP